MAVNEASPNKRRKTGNGPMTNEDITRANSTAQLFMGRQHRWMTGYVSPYTSEQTLLQQPPHPTSATSSGGRGMDASSGQQSMAARANVQQGDNGQALTLPAALVLAAQTSTGPDTAPMNTSPAGDLNTTAFTNNANASRKSVDPARNMPHPGLPSPVSSDGNRHSPGIGSNPGPAPAPPASTTTNRRPRGRPPRQPSLPHVQHALASNVVQTPPAQGAAQPHMLPSYVPNHTWTAQAQASMSVLPAPRQIRPHVVFHSSRLRSEPMWKKVLVFRDTHRATLNPIDSGRLMLLQDAIDAHDWFYIVLSQLHALSSNQANLPPNARVHPKCFASLDQLLSNNSAVTPMALQWLADFPDRLLDIFASQDKDLYNSIVTSVVRFLQLLPSRWDELVADCKAAQSPPVVEDMVKRFGLTSPILQTTIFRAIARMIWENPQAGGSASEGIEALESLHRMNQNSFVHNYVRDDKGVRAAMQAYAQALNLWKIHSTLLAQHTAANQNRPASEQQPPPVFVLPPAITQAFVAQQRPSGPLLQPHMALRPGQQPVPAMATRSAPPPSHIQTHGRQTSAPSPTQHSPVQFVVYTAPGMVQQPAQSVTGITPQMGAPDPRLAFPHETEPPRPIPTEPIIAKTSLHQAHLRSPILAPSELAGKAPRLYRFVVGFAMSPLPINASRPLDYMNFSVPEEEFAKIPPTVPPDKAGGRPLRHLTPGSLTYRLRCAAIPPCGFPTAKSWLEADNVWPDNLYLELNNHMLEPRRKLHHGKYLPIDLTTFLVERENRLTVCVLRQTSDNRPFKYHLAIEVVGVTTHERIFSGLHQLSAEDSLASIKKSLSGTDEGADDDIAITTSTTTINLTDPYYGDRMISLPVRSTGCLHRDCFDLETFLSTCKRERPDWPSLVDVWRCPICRGDVRPEALLVDGFLAKVVEELKGKGIMARAIVVEADGSWRVKKEDQKTGERSASLEREEKEGRQPNREGTPRPGGSGKAKKVIEVVELD